MTTINWEEQASYWKNKSYELELRLNDLREEFDEFTTSSKDLENELEAQLSQSDRRNKELLQRLEKANQEVESLKRLLDGKNEDVNKMQEECAALRKALDDKIRLLRQTEQLNDDLERKTRITLTSLGEFEKSLNEAIEKNVFLQSEKEELMEAAQRWRDESRDLHQELAVQRSRLSFPPSTNLDDYSEPTLETHSGQSDHELCHSQLSLDATTQTDLISTFSRESRSTIPSSKSMNLADMNVVNGSMTTGFNSSIDPNGQTMSPSQRISALNAVGNLMRTVGALESRLAFIMNSQYHQQTSSSNFKSSAPSRAIVSTTLSTQNARVREQHSPSGIPPPRILSTHRTNANINRRSTVLTSGQSFS